MVPMNGTCDTVKAAAPSRSDGGQAGVEALTVNAPQPPSEVCTRDSGARRPSGP